MSDLIIQIGNNEYNASFAKNETSNIIIGGKQYNIELLKEIDKNIHSLCVNNRVCQIEFDLDWDGVSTIYLDGFAFDFTVTDELRKMLAKYIQAAGVGGSEGLTKIKAPMPGMVVKILVDDGQEIKKGDPIVIVEAMKMENALKAPDGGFVKNISVAEGEAVEKDALLLEIHEDG